MGLRLSFITVFSVMTLLLLPDLLCAQPKSVGATFSFTGIGICYEHSLAKENSFVQVNLRAETPEVFIGRQNIAETNDGRAVANAQFDLQFSTAGKSADTRNLHDIVIEHFTGDFAKIRRSICKNSVQLKLRP